MAVPAVADSGHQNGAFNLPIILDSTTFCMEKYLITTDTKEKETGEIAVDDLTRHCSATTY